MANDIAAFNSSKRHDQEVVSYWLKKGRKARLATDGEDNLEKWDIELQLKDGRMVKVDTKYSKRSPSSMWYECLLHADDNRQSKMEYVLFCCRGTDGKYSRCFFMKREDLNKVALSKKQRWYNGKVSGKTLVDFGPDDFKRLGLPLTEFSMAHVLSAD